MRIGVLAVAVALVVGCNGKDKTPEPVKPGSGAAPLTEVKPAGEPDQPELPFALPKQSGKPPVKTTKPPSKQALEALSALELPGFTRRVRRLDDSFLDVVYALASPKLAVTVTVMPCMKCKPMDVDKWRAEQEALLVTLAPELHDRADTLFEIGATALGGDKVIYAYQLGHVVGDEGAFGHGYVVYFNDGVTQIRVIVAYEGPAMATRDELARAVPRVQLERVALAFLDAFAQAWAK